MKIMMKWFKKKKKSQSVDVNSNFPLRLDSSLSPLPTSTTSTSIDWISRLPAPLLERIFATVCPHTHDESYETCEQSTVDDTCMLCDLRDLAHCTQVSRRWRKLAANVLYHSIRIDPVHYCEREDILAEKRKHRSFINRNAEPEDTSQARLRLLARTLREDETGLPLKVRFFKTAFMTRETSKADLARIVATTPNLQYVDLPEGVFTDEQSCYPLKQELQGRCLDLRKMAYMRGAERSLELVSKGVWKNLEVLELSKLRMDPMILRGALGSLPCLRALKVSDMKAFNNDLFKHSDHLAPWPALSELIFSNTPNLTAEGLATYLFCSNTQESLRSLSLTATGVHPSALHQVLASAPSLEFLSIIEAVTSYFPAGVPPLSSPSLETLHYEITSAASVGTYSNTTSSYYTYLTTSLISNGLPALRKLYVRDPNFPESLIDLAPPAPAFAFDPDFNPPNPRINSTSSSTFLSPAPNRLSSNNPFLAHTRSQSHNQLPTPKPNPGLKKPLEVFSKGLDEMEWSFSSVLPPRLGRRGSATALRPVSSSGLDDGTMAGWAGVGAATARRSVIVGNGFGGFLAVPVDEAGVGRPKSLGGKKGSGKYDMWR